MSHRIEIVLEVIGEVHEKYKSEMSEWALRNLPIQVGQFVADRRGITNQSVLDTFREQLNPEVRRTAEFDRLLENWLARDSYELRDILLKHADHGDKELIKNTFYKASESEVGLAHEFGFDPNDEGFKEGKEKLRIHLVKERKPYLVKQAKEEWRRQQNGKISCSACNFSFSEAYGKLGDGFIEAHHTKPISSLTPDSIVKPSDLVPVCSNCHSMLHRNRPWLSVDELRKIVLDRRAEVTQR